MASILASSAGSGCCAAPGVEHNTTLKNETSRRPAEACRSLIKTSLSGMAKGMRFSELALGRRQYTPARQLGQPQGPFFHETGNLDYTGGRRTSRRGTLWLYRTLSWPLWP